MSCNISNKYNNAFQKMCSIRIHRLFWMAINEAIFNQCCYCICMLTILVWSLLYIPSSSLRSPPRSIAWVSQRQWMKYWMCQKMKVRMTASELLYPPGLYCSRCHIKSCHPQLLWQGLRGLRMLLDSQLKTWASKQMAGGSYPKSGSLKWKV